MLSLTPFAGYTVKCSGVLLFQATVAADATTYTSTGTFGATGDSICTVTATNTANLSATSATVTATLAKS